MYLSPWRADRIRRSVQKENILHLYHEKNRIHYNGVQAQIDRPDDHSPMTYSQPESNQKISIQFRVAFSQANMGSS